MNKFLKWWDEHILFVISLFLLVFIPLYPKIPLEDILPGYNVRFRLDDVVILLTFLIWGIQVLRKKIDLNKIPLLKPILIYIIIGFLSSVSAIFITKTVYFDAYQVAKVFLHWTRRIEYFSLFFVFYSSISSIKQLKYYLLSIVVAISGISVYGYGQKYWFWPAFSTMNREFSKGTPVYLTEHSRVLSTFGGHYDLAAYIILSLPLILGLIYTLKSRWLKSLLIILSIVEYWILMLTASRTSLFALLAGVTVMFIIFGFKGSWFSALKDWLIVMFVAFVILITSGSMSERLAQVIDLEQIKNNFKDSISAPAVNRLAWDNFGLVKPVPKVRWQADTPPTEKKPQASNNKPADVYVQPYISPYFKNATDSAIVRAPTYSKFSLKYGLSFGIRFDSLWPKAITGFKNNPLLGSGYATLVKDRPWQETTAESTDNDYLRMLGETGLLGILSFMAIIFIYMKILWQQIKIEKILHKFDMNFVLWVAGIAMTVGLLINALFIDVFESSKVAYTYWSLTGLILALTTKFSRIEKMKK